MSAPTSSPPNRKSCTGQWSTEKPQYAPGQSAPTRSLISALGSNAPSPSVSRSSSRRKTAVARNAAAASSTLCLRATRKRSRQRSLPPNAVSMCAVHPPWPSSSSALRASRRASKDAPTPTAARLAFSCRECSIVPECSMLPCTSWSAAMLPCSAAMPNQGTRRCGILSAEDSGVKTLFFWLPRHPSVRVAVGGVAWELNARCAHCRLSVASRHASEDPTPYILSLCFTFSHDR